MEVDRPNRQTQHRQGKSDPVDAVAAARAALSGTATGLPKPRDGNVEAIRVLMIARRSAVDTRIKTLNQLRHVVFCATPEIRSKFSGLTAVSLANKAAVLRPREGDDPVRYTTQVTIRTLGQRVKYLREEVKRLNRLLRPLIRETAPGLLEVFGVGFDTAAKLAGRRRRQPRTDPLRSRLRSPVWGRPHPRLVGQDRPASAQPGWEPPSQLGALPHRAHPHETRPSHPRLHRPSSRRRQNHGRDRPHPQTLRSPRSVQTPPQTRTSHPGRDLAR